MKNLITKTIKAAKDFKEGFIMGYNRSHGKIIGHISYNGKRIPIVYSPIAVLANNGIIANCSIYKGKYRIVVDDYYMALPQNVKDFVHQHELGHAYWLDNGHVNEHKLNDEFIADTYAAERIGTGNAINALRHIWVVLGTTGNVHYALSFPSRLKELGADVSDMYIMGGNQIPFYEEDLRRILES